MDDNQKQELIDFLISTSKETKDFVVEQAPQIFTEIVMYDRTFYAVSNCIWSVLMLYCIVVIALIIKFGDNCDKADQEIIGIAFVFHSLFLVLFTAGNISCALCSIQVWVAPKLYVINELQDIIK